LREKRAVSVAENEADIAKRTIRSMTSSSRLPDEGSSNRNS
jgi:hypothetical protein